MPFKMFKLLKTYYSLKNKAKFIYNFFCNVADLTTKKEFFVLICIFSLSSTIYIIKVFDFI